MADNSERSPGSGETIASKEIGGVKHQLVLLEHGSGSTATRVSATDPMPVADAAVAGFVDGLETLLTTLGGYLDGLEGGIGASGDAAATQGSTGTLSAKLRTVTAQLNTLLGHVDGIEGALGGTLSTDDPNAQAILSNIETLLGAELAVSDSGTQSLLGPTNDAAVSAGAAGTVSAKLRTITSQLSTIDGHVDGLEGFTDGLEGQLTTLASYLDGVETLLGGTLATGGNVAHDGADSGNPVKIGAKTLTTLAAVSASGDRTDITADKFGRLLVLAAPLDQRVTGTANFTNNSAADVIAAPGASIGIVVTDIVVTNAHATVATKVSIRDDATVKFTGYACAAGGGFALSNPDGLFVATANKAIRAICGTTGADVDVSISGYKIPA